MQGKMPIKLSQLLKGREHLLRRASLANSAFAYQLLSGFATRIARAELQGAVTLRSADPENEQFCPAMIALEGAQSVIEEYFTEEELIDLTDALAFVTGEEHIDVSFRLEDFAELFVTPLRAALEQAGVVFDFGAHAPQEHSPSDLA